MQADPVPRPHHSPARGRPAQEPGAARPRKFFPDDRVRDGSIPPYRPCCNAKDGFAPRGRKASREGTRGGRRGYLA
jgi:hypothetical protein